MGNSFRPQAAQEASHSGGLQTILWGIADIIFLLLCLLILSLLIILFLNIIAKIGWNRWFYLQKCLKPAFFWWPQGGDTCICRKTCGPVEDDGGNSRWLWPLETLPLDFNDSITHFSLYGINIDYFLVILRVKMIRGGYLEAICSFDYCLWLIMNVPIFWPRYITWELIVSWLSQYHISIYYQG